MPLPATPRKVLIYANASGEEPFLLWLNSLKDANSRRRILSRLRRLEQGNFGDCKQLQAGMFELRLFFGPGYRVYFGIRGKQLVLLLCAGDKSTQQKDIETALQYWMDYIKP